jgi:23S rRNA pseudouridine1911/1915/1917 synthase
LGFVHPRTGKQIRFDSEIPADMQALIEKWRKYVGVRQLEEE